VTELDHFETAAQDPGQHSWWQRAAVYQVYPRSFRDGNSDGLGDLRGVIEGLPYLASLGVDAIWLSPFYPSPQKDAGYDVSDPRAVDPMFGTIEDFAELVQQAHERGLRVIVDIVPNHVSASHPWFLEAWTPHRDRCSDDDSTSSTAAARTVRYHRIIGSRSSAARRGLASRKPTARGVSGTSTCSIPRNLI